MKEKNFEKYKIHLLIFVAAVAPPVNRAEHRAEMSGLRKRCYGSLVTDHQATGHPAQLYRHLPLAWKAPAGASKASKSRPCEYYSLLYKNGTVLG